MQRTMRLCRRKTVRLPARFGDEVNLVQQVFSKYLNNQTVTWSSTIAYLQVY